MGTLLLLVLLLAAAASAARDVVTPGRVCVYYGWPSLVNGAAGNTGAAAAVFGRYDVVLWPQGLENPSHSDHAKSVAILALLRGMGVTVWPGVSMRSASVESGISLVKAMGADGVFFNDADLYLGVTRQQQTAAVNYTHSLGLHCAAMAYELGDLYGVLGAGDVAVVRGYQVRDSVFVSEGAWMDMQVKAQNYTQACGVAVCGIATASAFSQAAYDYAFFSSMAYGLPWSGWAEDGFSADSEMALRLSGDEEANMGWAFTGSVSVSSGVHVRGTTSGWVEVDTLAHTGRFVWTVCKYNCSDHGTCLGLHTTAARCLCAPQWNGTYCDVWWPDAVLTSSEALGALGGHVACVAVVIAWVAARGRRKPKRDEKPTSTFDSVGARRHTTTPMEVIDIDGDAPGAPARPLRGARSGGTTPLPTRPVSAGVGSESS